MKILIDAGHNPSKCDTGAVGNGLVEQDVTYAIAKRVSEKLQEAGFEVKESRPEKGTILGTDVKSSLMARCNLANQWKADLFVSIHCNSFPSASAKGTETYIVGRGGQAEQLALKIQKAVVDALGTKDRGVKEENFDVLSYTDMPAVLVETAFLSNAEDAEKLKRRQEDFAESIFRGICGHAGMDAAKSSKGQTVMQLENVWVQEIAPKAFGAYISDAPKRERKCQNYFNLGFFARSDSGETITIGNFADCGHVFSQSKDNADWINVAKKALTTLVVTKLGEVYMTKTDTLITIKDLKTAISGIPILRQGKIVSMAEIKEEGYFGNECYHTWHGFLGVRNGSIVYVAAQCDFGQMPWILLALGIRDAIKVDGGGSFILVNNGKELVGTNENRRINNIGMWE